MKMYLEALKYFDAKGDVMKFQHHQGEYRTVVCGFKDNRNAIKYITEAINYFESQEKALK